MQNDMTGELPIDPDFVHQCGELGDKLSDLLSQYPPLAAVCVLPGMLACVMGVLGLSRDMIVAILDVAISDVAISEVADGK